MVEALLGDADGAGDGPQVADLEALPVQPADTARVVAPGDARTERQLVGGVPVRPGRVYLAQHFGDPRRGRAGVRILGVELLEELLGGRGVHLDPRGLVEGGRGGRRTRPPLDHVRLSVDLGPGTAHPGPDSDVQEEEQQRDQDGDRRLCRHVLPPEREHADRGGHCQHHGGQQERRGPAVPRHPPGRDMGLQGGHVEEPPPFRNSICQPSPKSGSFESRETDGLLRRSTSLDERAHDRLHLGLGRAGVRADLLTGRAHRLLDDLALVLARVADPLARVAAAVLHHLLGHELGLAEHLDDLVVHAIAHLLVLVEVRPHAGELRPHARELGLELLLLGRGSRPARCSVACTWSASRSRYS